MKNILISLTIFSAMLFSVERTDAMDINQNRNCPYGFVEDCDGSGECWPYSKFGDGFCDDEEQLYGADLSCHDLFGDGDRDCRDVCPEGQVQHTNQQWQWQVCAPADNDYDNDGRLNDEDCQAYNWWYGNLDENNCCDDGFGPNTAGEPLPDCLGECGGSAVEDDCGVCQGDNSTCETDDCESGVYDCAGVCDGSAVLDNCGICGGFGINATGWQAMTDASGEPQYCYWSEYTQGVDWDYYGTAPTLEECAAGCEATEGCTGFEHSGDSDGLGGDAYCSFWFNGACDLTDEDPVNNVPGYLTGFYSQDLLTYMYTGECACDGSLLDDCDECGGDGPDCTGECGGSAVEDCAGECGGSAVEDCAGECSGSAVEDCAGVCGGDAILDQCGDCNGAGLSCIDDCGVLFGDGSTCSAEDWTLIMRSDLGTYNIGDFSSGQQVGDINGNGDYRIGLSGAEMMDLDLTALKVVTDSGYEQVFNGPFNTLAFDQVCPTTPGCESNYPNVPMNADSTLWWSGGAASAYGSYHTGFSSVPNYHSRCHQDGHPTWNHWGHFHRGSINTGVYSFGQDCINEYEWQETYSFYGLFDSDVCISGVYDCAGVCDGPAVEDECGVCGGENYCADVTSCEVGESEIVDLPFTGSGNNTGMANDFIGYWDNGPGGDYAYGFELTETATVSISMCGTWNNHSHDAFLELYDATDCDNINMVAYNDDNYYYDYYGNCDGLDSYLEITLEPGFYYAVAGGYYDSEGGYDMSIESYNAVATSWSNEIELQGITDKSGIAQSFNLNDATFSANVSASASRDCDFVVGPDAGCDGVCFSEAVVDDCGECSGDNSSCADCAGVPNGDAELDQCGVCEGDGSAGDSFDVTDVVILVEAILNELWSSDDLYCSDLDGSGSLDIVDIVMMVEVILGSSRIADATDITLTNNGRSLALESNGFIGGIQMTLTHSSEFAMELTESAMVADYRTNGNQTVVIIAAPKAGDLFTTNSEFVVEDIVAHTTSGELEVNVNLPLEFGLSAAYPNPFNPSTSFDVYMSNTETISVDVYNVMGQLVYTIHSGELTSGKYTFNWDASNVSSGVYFIKATTTSNVATQKVMLMK